MSRQSNLYIMYYDIKLTAIFPTFMEVFDTKRMLISFIALIFTFSLCLLILCTDYYNPASASDTSLLQPWYKSLIDKAADNVDNNEDLLLAILGTDERESEKSRSDVIIVLKYNSKESKVIVVSIPRDSKISIPGKGLNKINAAYAYGSSRLQVDVLEDLLHVSGMKYIHINFEGFTKIIDSIGGIEVNAQKDFKRSDNENSTFARKGKNVLMGNDLLEYVRFRSDSENDFGRIKRQQEVLQSFYSKIIKPENISKLPQIVSTISKNIDSDMNAFFIMKYAKLIEKRTSLNFEFYTLKTSSEKSNGIWYEIIDEDNLQFISDLLQN